MSGIVENLRIALQGITSNRLRSILTTLGVLIGVGSVILLLAVGNGSSQNIQNQINKLGTNFLTISPGANPFGSLFGRGARIGTQSQAAKLTPNDVSALQDRNQAPDISTVSPVVTTSATCVNGLQSHAPQQFVGTVPTYEEARNYSVAEGEFFSSTDVSRHDNVIVIGQTVATDLFPGTDPVGQSLQCGRERFDVIGLLASKGSNGIQDQDDVAMAPYTAVQDDLSGYGGFSSITIQATSTDTIDAAQGEATEILLGTHHITNIANADFSVLNQASLVSTATSTSRTFTVLLGAVAAISLLVGGIGVMNIMLVTVTERTREIGIRKAVGATRGAVLTQFLTEAVLLSVIGGIAGVAAGYVGSRFKIEGVYPVIETWSVFVAFGVSVLIGLIFGAYPANRAASMNPIDALRYE